MGITATRLRDLGLVDEVVREPLGGAHRDPVAMGEALHQCLLRQLRELEALDTAELLRRRSARLQSYGSFRES
jgi:acetyl-CoA carboxylase carboxyl transferase subunit alpha